jgi:hypothetical protein
MLRVESLVNSWRSGYRGALLLSGRRFSGKSLFGEMIASRFFRHHTLRLLPESHLKHQGRTHETGFDLAATLEFLRKYPPGQPTLVWIDDLETWWAPEHSLHHNVRALIQFVDQHSRDYFVVVAMGNGLEARLDRTAAIRRVFLSEINMDNISRQEVQQAILIRHGATHQKLVDEKGEELSPLAFRRKVRAIYRVANGNIGDALSIWSYSTHRLEKGRVVNRFTPGFALPDFLTPESALLLSSIFLQKRTNEFRMRKLFGPAFPQRYLPVLRRLINVGVLQRQMDDWLEINPLLVNELGLTLEAKKYLQYSP